MDRNLSMGLDGRFKLVALRKESVDRNHAADISTRREAKSLSARRAWIETALPELIPLADPGRSPQGERG